MVSNKAEVTGLKVERNKVSGRVRISYDSDITIGYSGNADDETLSKYLIEAAIAYLTEDLLED